MLAPRSFDQEKHKDKEQHELVEIFCDVVNSCSVFNQP